MIIMEQSAELVQHSPEPEKLIERIARVCYHSEARMACGCADGYCGECRKRRDAFLGGLARRGHESVFEHAYATFRLVTDRGISHELVRHRLASYTQSSTRYIRYDQGMPVVEPVFSAAAEREAWAEAMLAAEKAYLGMLAAGVPLQNARDVLPTCAATVVFMTANFREWRHVIALRTARGAHPKMRGLFELVRTALAPLCRVYFDAKGG